MSEFLKEKYVAPALEELNVGCPIVAQGESNPTETMVDANTEADN